MYVRPDHRQLVALADLSRMPSWSIVKSFLGAESAETSSRLMDANDAVVLHKLQGRAKLLGELVEQVDTAQAQLERIRQ